MAIVQKFTVKRAAEGMGLGLFAAQDISEGEYLMNYEGRLISTEEANTLTTRYLFEIDDTYTIDGSTRENSARYINHFCNPNVEAEIEAGQIKFYAMRAIKKGEELGFDYGSEYFNEFIKPHGCKCPSCRHKLD